MSSVDLENPTLDDETIQEKTKESELMEKLEKLQEAISNSKLSGLKRAFYKIKFAIIEAQLDRRKGELTIQAMQDEYNASKGKSEKDKEFTSKVETDKNELEKLHDEILEINRRIEKMHNDNIEANKFNFDELNEEIEAFNAESQGEKIKSASTKGKSGKTLKELEEKKKTKEAELKQKYNELLNYMREKRNEREIEEAEFSKQIKEYKPSIWQSVKTVFGKISESFREWREESKQKKEARKKAIAMADAEVNEKIASKNESEFGEKTNEWKETMQVDPEEIAKNTRKTVEIIEQEQKQQKTRDDDEGNTK